jgi:hypothetical protein
MAVKSQYQTKNSTTGGYDVQHFETELAQIADASGAGAHNALYRGKDLTAYFNSGGMSAAIADGTFADIYPGDYIIKSITVNGTTYNVKWIVMDLDYHLHRGDQETTAHHVVLMPEANIGTVKWNGAETNTTEGGFLGSTMWTVTLPLYAAGIEAAFGAAHVLKHRELLTNSMSAAIESNAGAGWMGAANNWAWTDVKVNIANEPMMYGGRAFSSSSFDIGECNTQLAACRHDKSKSFQRAYLNWLRAVAHSADACCANIYGDASRTGVLRVGGVRPYFLLK